MTDPSVPKPTQNSKLVTAAIVVAFLMVAADLVSALFHPYAGLLSAILPLIAAIGLMRKRVWAAYGFALVEVTQGIVAMAVAPEQGRVLILSAGVFAVACAVFFFFAGRSLARSGASRGWRCLGLRWLVCSLFL